MRVFVGMAEYSLRGHPSGLNPHPFLRVKHQGNIKKNPKNQTKNGEGSSQTFSIIYPKLYIQRQALAEGWEGNLAPGRTLGTLDLPPQNAPAKNCRSWDSPPEFLRWVMGCVQHRSDPTLEGAFPFPTPRPAYFPNHSFKLARGGKGAPPTPQILISVRKVCWTCSECLAGRR